LIKIRISDSLALSWNREGGRAPGTCKELSEMKIPLTKLARNCAEEYLKMLI
jgi:hypothetical protein